MTPEASTRAVRQMLTSWARNVSRHPHRSPVSERAINSLIARCEQRLDRGATAADVLLLEVAPFLETTAEGAAFSAPASRERAA